MPDPQALETFERSKLDWAELTAPEHAQLLDWYRRLIALRAESLDRFANARPQVKVSAKASWLRFTLGGLLVVFNFSTAPQRVPLPSGEWRTGAEL